MAASIIGAAACGGGSSNDAPAATFTCLLDASFTGGVTADVTREQNCSGAFSYSRSPEQITVRVVLTDEHLEVRAQLFGLTTTTQSGSLPAGVVVIQNENTIWQPFLHDGSACTATVEGQVAESAAETLVTASVSCSDTLTAASGAAPDVKVERLRIRAPYGP